MDPNKILIWAQVGQQLVQIGSAAFTNLQNALAAKGIEADHAQLQKLRELYDARIQQRENEIGGTTE